MKIKATIFFKPTKGHPDTTEHGKEMSFTDTYVINPDYFNGKSDIYGYIKQDLKLVAGGGYNWKYIKDVRFEFEEDVA